MTPCEVFHVVEGEPEAPPLVLSNSLGTTIDLWDRQADELSRHTRLVRYDHRGHGRSPVPPGPYSLADLGGDVVALLDRLEIARASLAGVSIGGMVGLWLAANVPERIDRLIVCCSSPYMPPASAWTERAAAVREAGTPEVIADTVVGRWLTPPYAQAHPELVARLRAMVASTPAEGYAACCAALERMDLREDLARITAPTLVIGGEADPSAPVQDHGAVIAAGVPNARLEVVPTAHLCNVEQPSMVTRLILDHLELA